MLPADEAGAAEVFDAVLESIERHRKAEDATVSHLRIEPRWQRLPDFVRGFRPPALSDRFSEPRDTLCIDLRPSEDEILAQMKPKGRYNVRVARKHGVAVVRDNSYQGLIDFMRIQRCTAVRKGIEPTTPAYFRAMLSRARIRGARPRCSLPSTAGGDSPPRSSSPSAGAQPTSTAARSCCTGA